jgi:beta-lactamase superfamily II metal-dependent hydrolase
MPERKIIYSLILFLFILNLILSGMIFHFQNKKLKVIFLDVGQGDAILIEQENKQILIDGGPDEKIILEKLGKYVPFWDRKIEVLIATHPDQDHIDGLVGVMKNYKIGAVIDNKAESDSQVYKNYTDIINGKNIPRVKAEYGNKINLGGANLEILYPSNKSIINEKDTNAGSVTAKLNYGANSFLLTGDFPTEKDMEIFSSGADLSARILKIAHHGSKYATSGEFLKKVKPETAVISVGKNNRYGHPAPEILSRLKNDGIEILRTDEMGDIIYDCKNIENKCTLGD